MRTDDRQRRLTLPTPRSIRRACRRELLRTIKRLKQYVPAELAEKAEELYVQKVTANLIWIAEHRSDRKRLADWWDEHVCADIAELWSVDRLRLSAAFRDAFGGVSR